MAQTVNLCTKLFRSRLEAEDWVAVRVVRRSVQTSYLVKVSEIDKMADKVEVLDASAPGYTYKAGDEFLAKYARIHRKDGVYRVSLPA